MVGIVVVVVVVLVVEFVVPAGGAEVVPTTVSTGIGFALAGLGLLPTTATTLGDPVDPRDGDVPVNPMPPLPEAPLGMDVLPPEGGGFVFCESGKLGTFEGLELECPGDWALISGRVIGPEPTLKPVTAHSVAAATATEATTPRPAKPGVAATALAATAAAAGSLGDA
jgi:hypothetical protein